MRDIQLNATEDFPLFTTRVDTGAPTDVAGIVVSAYPDNSATQLTAGITVTSPDSIAGYANIRVVATVANGYSFGTHYTLVVTTGTVNSVSVVGAIVGEFTIRKNVPGLVRAFIAQASSSTTLVFDAATSYADNFLNGHFVVIVAGTGAGQSRFIDSWTNSTDTATVSPAWTTTPDTTSVCECYATPPASTGAPIPANTTQWLGTAAHTPTVAGVPDVNVRTVNDVSTSPVTTIKAVQGLAVDGVIPTATNLTNAPTNGDLTATMKTSVTTAATAATPTAAAVTADVGITQAGADKVWGTAARTLTAPTNLSIPTATQNADALLDRDMSTGVDSGSPTVRTPRQALRALRNKVDASSPTLTVYKEDDATASWTAALTTDILAAPVTISNPAGGA